MNTCIKCSDIRVHFSIRTSNDLKKAIIIAKNKINDGVIVEIKEHSSHIESFINIPENGPWEDFLNYHFKCSSCGQLFRLKSENYHGLGGQWEPLTHIQ